MKLIKAIAVGMSICLATAAFNHNEINIMANGNIESGSENDRLYVEDKEIESTDNDILSTNSDADKELKIVNNEADIYEDVNEFYANEDERTVYNESVNEFSSADELRALSDNIESFNTAEEAGIFYRNNLVKRNEHITFKLNIKNVDTVETYAKMRQIAFEETDKSYEGDYIYWNWMNTKYKPVIVEDGIIYDLWCEYWSTLEQENMIDKTVKLLLEEEFFGWQKRTDYENVKDIYDWMTFNIKYYSGRGNHSTYSAIVNREAVCQGYATTFYRLAREMGISSRVIASELHGWNIVKLDGKYYDVDATWDAQKRADEWEYFLKCDNNFGIEGSHYRKARFNTAEFNKQYPMTTKDYKMSKDDYGFSIECTPHVQKYGWINPVGENQIAGTTGEGKRVEAVRFSIKKNSRYDLSIEYMGHSQSYGWSRDWLYENSKCGTEGVGKRLEAVRIRLTGSDSSKYDLYYQAHVQSFGWLGWAKNGEYAGTEGLAKRMEALRFVVVPKGEKPEGMIGYCFIKSGKSSLSTDKTLGDVYYNTHVQSYGWQNYVYDGSVSGTFGEAKRLEGITIGINTKETDSGVMYKTHIQGNGWEDSWKLDGQLSGTTGQSKRLEAIRICLYGSIEKNYDIFYRVHSQTYGWLGWAKNGEPAGTEGLSKRLESIQIVVMPKGVTPQDGMNKAAFRR